MRKYIFINFEFLISGIFQKEIALYTASKINSEFHEFNIDQDIDPLFKVMHVKIYISFLL